ncbi:hypothetical protein M1563_05135 [Patescibacteria group bacterium]|nr:hypothetical protein [Patescibacteria group bacterium]
MIGLVFPATAELNLNILCKFAPGIIIKAGKASMKKHLAIMDRITIEAILAGIKTIETRFSQHKIVPFGQVGVGDIIYMKPPGEEVIGQFQAKKVISYAGMTQFDVEKIWSDYGQEISVGQANLDQKYQQGKLTSKYGTLIFITQSERFITSPIKIKKRDLRGWMIL